MSRKRRGRRTLTAPTGARGGGKRRPLPIVGKTRAASLRSGRRLAPGLCLLPWLALAAAARDCVPAFEAQPTFRVGGNAGANALLDLNEDGHLDLITGLSFFLGDGSGGFSASFRLPSTREIPEGFDVKAADFDLDGHLDLAIVMIGGPHMNFYFGRGSRERPSELFDGPHTVVTRDVVEGVWHIDVADLNQDGLPDVVGVSIIRSDMLIVLNQGSRGFLATGHSVQAELGRGGNHMLATADFDGDGHDDVATGFGNQLRVLFGDGAGGFSSELARAMTHPGGTVRQGHRFRAADVDGDGRAELFATGDEWILVYLGREIDPAGLPASAAHALHVSLGVRFVEVADMNADGVPDVTAVAAPGARSVYRTFLGHLADGVVSFDPAGEARATALSGRGSVLAVGDLNGDHAPEIVLTTEDTGLGQVFLNTDACRPPILRGDANADGRFDIGDAVTVAVFLFGGGTIECAPAAEVNGDGSLDLSDVISILNHLFLSGPPPADPGPVDCG